MHPVGVLGIITVGNDPMLHHYGANSGKHMI